jgi:hypothetical protein
VWPRTRCLLYDVPLPLAELHQSFVWNWNVMSQLLSVMKDFWSHSAFFINWKEECEDFASWPYINK